jgi:hypothetical protein
MRSSPARHLNCDTHRASSFSEADLISRPSLASSPSSRSAPRRRPARIAFAIAQIDQRGDRRFTRAAASSATGGASAPAGASAALSAAAPPREIPAQRRRLVFQFGRDALGELFADALGAFKRRRVAQRRGAFHLGRGPARPARPAHAWRRRPAPTAGGRTRRARPRSKSRTA